MQVYRYDEKTKEYIGTEIAIVDPLESVKLGRTIYLIPQNCTEVKPPDFEEGVIPIFSEEANVWTLVEDNRGTEYWLNTDDYGAPARICTELGSLPEGAVFTPPKKTLEELRESLLEKARQEFVEKRDAIRYVDMYTSTHTYGFDCMTEDIVNFLSAWNGAKLAKSSTSIYKVWINEEEKALVELMTSDFEKVFKEVRESQIQCYRDYEIKKQKIMDATTEEELLSL